MTLGQGYDTPLGHGQLLCKILSRSNLAVRSSGPDIILGTGMCAPWVKVVTPLGHGQELCEIPVLSRSNLAVRSYGPDTQFEYLHCDLDLGDMTLCQGHDTPLGPSSLANVPIRFSPLPLGGFRLFFNTRLICD